MTLTEEKMVCPGRTSEWDSVLKTVELFGTLHMLVELVIISSGSRGYLWWWQPMNFEF